MYLFQHGGKLHRECLRFTFLAHPVSRCRSPSLPREARTAESDARLDTELFDAARQGDRDAYGVLLKRHGRAAYATALAIVGDPDAAEDVCQDALFRIWQRLGECRAPDRFAAWMASAVRRHALNAIRSRPPRAPLDPESVLWPGPSPDRHTEQVELRSRLLQALAGLSTEQRQAVLLFDLAEWPHARIAEALGTTEAMSRQYLMQGRRRLRRLLEGKENDP